MVADIRALTICNLGTVIQGSLADEAISVGQGLIRCRGQLVLDGLQTPASGTSVELAYIRAGRIVRIPRKLRVISFFADPFANTTTVQIGDKLAWLAEKRPSILESRPEPDFPDDADPGDPYQPPAPEGAPADQPPPIYVFNGVCWELSDEPPDWWWFDLASNGIGAGQVAPTRPAGDNFRAPITIPASIIASKCCFGLGITPVGLQLLTSHYGDGEITLERGYVAVLEQLLSSESLVGYLDTDERLIIRSLVNLAIETGPQINEVDIVEIGPIGSSEIPPTDVIDLADSTIPPVEPPADPEPTPPVAYDFRLPIMQAGTSATYGGLTFLNNVEYDYFQFALGSVKLQSVSGGTGASASLTETGSVIVTATEGFIGIAFLGYTVTDGFNTTSASAFFQVIEGPPPPEPPAEFPPLGGAGGRQYGFTFGTGETIKIPYNAPGGAVQTAEYLSTPVGFNKEIYGPYGEVLFRYEFQEIGGASVAGNVYKQYLEASAEFSDLPVRAVTITNFYYNYDFPEPQVCTIGNKCDPGFSLPEDPSSGDTYKYGQCIYVYDGTRWVRADTAGGGITLVAGQQIPLSAFKDFQPVLERQVTTTWESGFHAAGSINWPVLGTDALPPLDETSYVAERVEIYYRKDQEKGLTRTDTFRYAARYKTAEGQQYLAALGDTILNSNDYNTIRAYGVELVFDSSESKLVFDVNYGQQAADTDVSKNDPTNGSTGDGGGTNTGNSGDSGSGPRPPLTPTMPKTWDPTNGYDEKRDAWKEANEKTLRLRYNRAAQAVATGNRFGMSLQVVPWALPIYPLDPIYLNLRSVVGAYRANGITVAFSSDGILANCDALFVGGVGGTGTPWFPLPSGATLEPAPAPVINEDAVPPNSIEVPEGFDPNAPGDVWSDIPVDEDPVYPIELTPPYIVPPIIPTVIVSAGVRVGMTFQRFSYSLAPVVKDQAVGIALGLSARRENGVKVPSTVTELLALNPSVSTGYAAQLGAAAVTTAAVAPRVASSYAAQVPAASITVAAAPGPIVPREALRLFAPVAGIAIGAVPPVLSTGVGVAVPAAVVAVNGVVPRAGGNLGDNYGLTALFEDDLLALL